MGWRGWGRPGRGARLVAGAILGAVVLAGSPAQVRGQTRPVPLPADAELRTAFLDWDRGDYHLALRRYLRILDSADTATVRAVATLTGELHPVRELAPDGRRPVVSPDGRFAAFEVEADGRTTTRVLGLPGGEPVAELEGTGAVFHGDRVAYRAGDTVRIRELATTDEVPVRTDDLLPGDLAFDGAGALWISGVTREGRQGRLARVEARGEAVGGTVAIPEGVPRAVVGVPGAGVGRVVVEMSGGRPGLAVVGRGGAEVFFPGGGDPSVSADGSTLAYLRDRDGRTEMVTVALDGGASPRVVLSSDTPVEAARLSPDGAWVAYQAMPLHDWEVFAVPAGGGSPVRLSRDIQHDGRPLWLDGETVLAVRGEGRHMRSFVYSLDGSPPLKLFHNNTVRTIAPEYAWAAGPGGDQVLVVAERDGDTVSPERGLYLVDRTREVTTDDLRARLGTALAAEEALRLRGVQAFRLVAGDVRAAVDQVAVERVSAHAHALHRMGSRAITRPGNRAALDYLVETLRRFGYEPEVQWFEPRPGVETANVVVRLDGTVDPELVYVVGTHFDSVERGPGADDNGSGTAALLEVARVLRDRPLPATVELAFFTGEEAGLLGSREYVRRARDSGMTVVGALNNDMVGWANDHRLDNTIRYSNAGIRDVQHAAAILFSELITYDARYYKFTDAAAFHEAWGDMVGGMGSYPVLGNPHYHRATDRVETVDHRLVAEVARTTVASIMLLASAPSRLEGVTARAADGYTRLRWERARESDVVEYVVLWIDADGGLQEQRFPAGPGPVQEARLPGVDPGTTVRMKARNGRGHVGWDWAEAVVQPPDVSAPGLRRPGATPRPRSGPGTGWP